MGYEIKLITEIPQGAIPVNIQEYSKSHDIYVDALSAEVINYYFYFPEIGNFETFRATVTIDGNFAGTANGSKQLEVKSKLTKVSKESIQDIMNTGSDEDILTFIKERNIYDKNLFQVNQILHKLKNEKFFLQVIDILDKRNIFDEKVWSFTIKHAKKSLQPQIRRYFEEKGIYDKMFSNIPYFKSNWKTIDKFRLKDYNPLINPRAHSVGEHKMGQILNQGLKESYNELLKYLIYKQSLNYQDLTILTGYLLLQERLSESLQLFKRIIPDKNADKTFSVQYDYMKAYLSIYTEASEQYKTAKTIVTKYLAYPVLFWRNMFVEIANQLAELENTEKCQLTVLEDESKVKDYKISAEQEEFIEIEKDNNSIKVRFKNSTTIYLKYFKTDLEVLFSKNPFLSHDCKNFSLVAPFIQENIQVQKKSEINEIQAYVPEWVLLKHFIYTFGNSFLVVVLIID